MKQKEFKVRKGTVSALFASEGKPAQGNKPREFSFVGAYRISTKGKTAAEVVAAVNLVELHHDKKSARLNGFSGMWEAFVVDGVTFALTDCTIRDVGEPGGTVELYVSARDAAGKRPKCLPLRMTLNSVDEIPPNEVILGMVVNAVEAENAAATAEQDKIDEIERLLGGA